MKRIVALFLAILLALAVSGCTKNQPQDADMMEPPPFGGQPAQDTASVLAEGATIIWGRVEKTVGKTLEILSHIKNNPSITQDELAKRLHLSVRGVEYHLKKLREQGLIARKGGRKEGYWEII